MHSSLWRAGRAFALVLLCNAAAAAQTPRIVIDRLELERSGNWYESTAHAEGVAPGSRLASFQFIPDLGWFGDCYGWPVEISYMRSMSAQATKITWVVIPPAATPSCVRGDGSTLPPEYARLPVQLTVAVPGTYTKTLRFSGYDWTVKSGITWSTLFPGPNRFCDSSPTVDAAGKLHLRIEANGCNSEIFLKKPLGYGTYRFTVETPLSQMHENAVLGMFTWSYNAAESHREIDVELSRWRGTVPTNAQFVVQPYTTPGQMQRFNAPTAGAPGEFSFEWAPGKVHFLGGGSGFLVDGSGVPSSDDEAVHLHLYWDRGVSGGVPQEVVISAFQFTPMILEHATSVMLDKVPARGMKFPYTNITLGQWSFENLPPHVRVVPGSYWSEITVMPNWSTQPRVHQGAIKSSIPLLTPRWRVEQAGATGTLEQRTIGMLYSNLLGRVPADEERDFQLVKAVHQGTPMSQLAANFFSTPEFQNTGRFAAGLYVGLLCRDADYPGWMFQRDVLSSGAMSQKQLVTAFLSTPEAALRYGSGSNAEFVRTLYTCVLGRTASDADVQFQVNALQSGAVSRTDMAWAMLNAPEFQAGANRRITAFLLYAALMNRQPSTAEVQAWANVLVATPLSSAADVFLKSPEFTQLMQ